MIQSWAGLREVELRIVLDLQGRCMPQEGKEKN